MAEKTNGLKNLDEAIRFVEGKRRRHLFLFVLYIILSSLFGTSGFGLVVASAIAFSGMMKGLGIGLGMASFLLLMPVFLLLCLKQRPRYERILYESLSPFIRERNSCDGMRLLTKKEAKPLLYHIGRVFRRNLDFDGKTLFEGSIRGISFATLLISNDLGKSRKNARTSPISSRIIYFKIDGIKFEDTIIKEKNTLSYFRKNVRKTSFFTESIDFNRRYDIYAENEKRLPSLLNPVFLDGVISLDREMESSLNAYFHDEEVFAVLRRYESPFYAGLSRKVNLGFVETLKKELSIPYRVFSALNLKRFAKDK